MLGNIFPPFTTMQEMNLDWILTKVKNILRFVPDDGTVGQILRRTRSGAEWSDEQGGSGAVNSVNGQTGDVVLTASDVGALPDTYVAPVTSVNGMTGDVIVSGGGAVDSVNGQTGTVVLDADDVGALPDTTVIPDSTSDLVNDSGFVDAAGAAAAAPVQSVNGQTGSVSLTIPDSTSDLLNDSGFVDAAGAAAAAPVQSVNGQTGAVVLDTYATGTITFTRTLGSGTFTQLSCQKVGNVVNVGARAYGFSQTAMGNWFRLPAGFRPRATVIGYGTMNTGAWIPLWCTIDTDGYVIIEYSTGATANQVAFAATFAI